MRSNIRLAVCVVTVAVLSACSSWHPMPVDATPRARLVAKCKAYIGLMQIAVDNKALMSESSKTAVDVIRNTYSPICKNIDSVENKKTVLENMDAALGHLRRIPAIQKDLEQ